MKLYTSARSLSVNKSSFFKVSKSISTTSRGLQYFKSKEKKDTDGTPSRPYEKIPKTKFFLGVNWTIMKNPHGLMDYLVKQAKIHGKIFRDKGGPGVSELLYVMDPRDVMQVFRAGDRGYPIRFSMSLWSQARKELNLPRGMFLDEHEKWLNQRVPISKYIMMPRKMADYHLPFNEVSLDFIKYVRDKRGNGNVLLDTVTALNKWSFEAVALFVLGKRLGCLEDPMPQDCGEFFDNVQGYLDLTKKLLMGFPLYKLKKTRNWKQMVKHFEIVSSIATTHVRSKTEEMKSDGQTGKEAIEDLLGHMIHSGAMSIKEVAVNAVDLIVAGRDTASLTMASCLFCLATNPQVQDKLRQEILRVVGEEGVVNLAHIHHMPYLRGCVMEAQRLYPATPHISRILREDVVLSGYNVPAGVPIVLATAVSARLPEHFPEPEKFMPERWNKRSGDLPNPYAFLAFGFGKRMCVGQKVAELEMHILLAQLVKHFDLKFMDKKPLKYKYDWYYGPGRDMNIVFNDL